MASAYELRPNRDGWMKRWSKHSGVPTLVQASRAACLHSFAVTDCSADYGEMLLKPLILLQDLYQQKAAERSLTLASHCSETHCTIY